MNKQRIKSIGILLAVLIAGILIGLLVPAAYHRMGNHQKWKTERRGGGNHRDGDRRKDWFISRVKQVVGADADQEKAIDSVASWTNERLDAIQRQANEQTMNVLDSAVTRISPVLREDQQKQLQEFRERVASRANEHDKRN